MSKAIKIIFTLSVLTNLILVGIIGGHVYKRYQRHNPPEFKELSDVSRDKLEENIAKSRQQMREHFKDMKQYHQNLKEVVTAEKFDMKAYEAAISKVLDAKDDMARQKAQMMGKTLSELSQEERQKMSTRLLKGLSHKRGQKDRQSRDRREFPEKH